MIKSKLWVAVSLFALAGTAFAGERTDFPIGPSTKTRAQVLQELEQARNWNWLPFGEIGQSVQPGPSSATRAQVTAEAVEAKRLGLIPMGEANARMPTNDEQARIRAAGERASARAS